MEWCVEADDLEALGRVRREFAAHLAADADETSDIRAAEVVFSEIVGNVHRHALGPALISLDWTRELPVLTVRDLGHGFTPTISPPDPAAVAGRGLYLVSQLVGQIEVTPNFAGGARVSVTLPVRRKEASPPPEAQLPKAYPEPKPTPA